MKILIATYGSRGDVQPYVALGKGLQHAGHHVTIGTSKRFSSFIEKHGLKYGYMSDGLLSIIDTYQGRHMLENTTSIFDMVKQNIKLAKQLKPLQVAQIRETWEMAKTIKPDFILFNPNVGVAPHISEKLGIGCMLATPVPAFVPTTERPFIMLPHLNLGGWYNRLSYKIINLLSEQFLGKYIEDFRSDIGLARLKKIDFLKTAEGMDIPVLHALSEAVVPRPSDWPLSVYITGYWFLDYENSWRPPQDLQTFVEAGPPPIYVGFGSMAGRYPQRLASTVIEALQIANLRGIIATGWGGLTPETLPESIFKIESVPHDWLFPRVSAVVHHGGAGTTAAGLRAGKPSVIIPFFGDQPFWGRHLHVLGVGVKPISQKKLTAQKLAAAIKHVVSNPVMKRKAKDIGKKIREEDGIGKAVTVIEKVMNTHQYNCSEKDSALLQTHL